MNGFQFGCIGLVTLLVACGGESEAPSSEPAGATDLVQAIEEATEDAVAAIEEAADAAGEAADAAADAAGDAAAVAAVISGAAGGAANAVAGAMAGDCPAALGEYEKFVDQYVSFMKKAAAGDMAAMTKAQKIMAQATKSGKALTAMKGGMTVPCMKQYSHINQKMMNAAMEIGGASAADKAQMKEANKAADAAMDKMACAEKCQKITDPMKMSTCIQKCM